MNQREPTNGDHPRGTLAILAIYGVLFAAAWMAVYFLIYAPRGGVHP